jgi:hypothetical protein
MPPSGPTFTPVIKPPTPQQQSWGTVISIVIILLMVVVGAFYTWGKKIAEERALVQQLTATSTGE